MCPLKCISSWIGDNVCNVECRLCATFFSSGYVKEGDFDGGDCSEPLRNINHIHILFKQTYQDLINLE